MFELHLTCTKDISKIHIDFSDGTSAVTESVKPENPENRVPDWDSYRQREHQEIVRPPELPEISDRKPKIDEHLNNLDF